MERTPTAGYTLTELLAAAALGAIVLAGSLFVFASQRKAFWTERQFSEMQQNLYLSADAVTRDARMAGYGIKVPAYQLAAWVTWITNATDTVTVTRSGTGSDALTLIGAMGAPIGALQAASLPLATVLTVTPEALDGMDTGSRKLLFIGRLEMARVVSILGNRVTLSTHPTQSRGMRHAYPAGTPIERVDAVTYRGVSALPGLLQRPGLLRDEHNRLLTNRLQMVTGLDIEGFYATWDGRTLVLRFDARSQNPDGAYTHPTVGDHYYRDSLSATVTRRNP
jgi:hypothetical protein